MHTSPAHFRSAGAVAASIFATEFRRRPCVQVGLEFREPAPSRRKTMKRALFLLCVLASPGAFAQVHVYVPAIRVNVAPPAARIEVQPPRPSAGDGRAARHRAWGNHAHGWLRGDLAVAP